MSIINTQISETSSGSEETSLTSSQTSPRVSGRVSVRSAPVSPRITPLEPAKVVEDVPDTRYYAWMLQSAFNRYLTSSETLYSLFYHYLAENKADLIPPLKFYFSLGSILRTPRGSSPSAALLKQLFSVYVGADDGSPDPPVLQVPAEVRKSISKQLEAKDPSFEIFAPVLSLYMVSLRDEFKMWQEELARNPAVARIQKTKGNKLWIEEDAFKFVLFDNAKCFDAFREYLSESSIVSSLNFLSKIAQYESLDFLTDWNRCHDMAKEIIADHITGEDGLFHHDAELIESISARLEASNHPSPHLFANAGAKAESVVRPHWEKFLKELHLKNDEKKKRSRKKSQSPK